MKALWAFEPFHQDNRRIKGMYGLLKQIVGSPSNIEAGFVVTRKEPVLNQAFDVPFDKRFSHYPRELTRNALRKAGVAIENKKIHIVDFPTFSDTQAVDRFLALAKARGSGLISLYTHARHGFFRFTLGSFAETAIHRSQVSLLLVNPKTEFSSRLKHILFASDFSSASKAHLDRVIEICKRTKSGLTVLHQTEMIYKWSLDESSPEVHAYRKKVDRMKTWTEEKCQRAGIDAQVVIHSEFQPTTELILKVANRSKADLIVVCSKAGRAAALMGGSITRQVVRRSKQPVLILK